MKGVLICGGTGSRLRPLTEITNKSLLPVYDKPLISYSLEILLKAGITDIAVVTGPEHFGQISAFLGSGARFGCRFAYTVQEKPEGVAQALGLAEDFVNGDNLCAILADNVYFDDLSDIIRDFKGGGHVFLKEVPDPERFGVAELDADNRVLSFEEKPKVPKSNYAVTGCYIYDSRCFDVIRTLKPSWRNEYEITDIQNWYTQQADLAATILEHEWIDAGTFESLHKASKLAREKVLGKKVAATVHT